MSKTSGPRLGLITAECETSPRTALSDRPTHLLPLWYRWARSPDIDARVVAEVQAAGVEPVLYAESTGAWHLNTSEAIDRISLMAARARGSLVRVDPEPNGSLYEWTKSLPSLYVDNFRWQAELIHAEGARTAWCVAVNGKDISQWYPGDEYVDVVGFDSFSRKADSKHPLGIIRRLRELAPGKPVWWFEAGRLASLPNRAAWLRSLATVPVDAVLVFDRRIVVPAHLTANGKAVDDDFRWSKAMVKAWEGMVG